MPDTTEDPKRPGYTLDGRWMGALRRCSAHGNLEPCDTCNYWIGAGY